MVRGHSTATIEDVIIKNLPNNALLLWDDSHTILKNVTIDQAGRLSGTQADRAAIYAGANNTASPLTTSVALVNTSITNSVGPAIWFLQYFLASTQTLTLTASHLDDNGDAGVVFDVPMLNVSSTLTITATNSTVSGNAGAAFVGTRATVKLTGGAVANNTLDGVRLSGATAVNAITIRGTTFANNGGDNVSMAGTSASAFDLGKTGDPGGVVFTGVAATKSAVRLDAAIQGFAVGNTWVPNEQGADAGGLYTAPTTLTVGTGRNATLATGATLVVQP